MDFRRQIAGEKTEAAILLQPGKSLHEIRQEAEERAIAAALARNEGNITKAARELRISRQMLHRKLKQV